MTHIYLNKQPPFPQRALDLKKKKEQNYGTGLKRWLLSHTWVCLPDFLVILRLEDENSSNICPSFSYKKDLLLGLHNSGAFSFQYNSFFFFIVHLFV